MELCKQGFEDNLFKRTENELPEHDINVVYVDDGIIKTGVYDVNFKDFMPHENPLSGSTNVTRWAYEEELANFMNWNW